MLTAAAPPDVGGAVQGDPAHPRARLVELGHRRPPALRLGERLLDDVLGARPVAEQGGDHGDEAAVLVPEEDVERRRSTLIGHRHNTHTPQTVIRLTSDHLSDPPRDPVT